jgi:hypothetical protein
VAIPNHGITHWCEKSSAKREREGRTSQTSVSKLSKKKGGVIGSGVQFPVASQVRALGLVFLEQDVERGYDGVGSPAKLLGEVPLADNNGSFWELPAHALSVRCDLIGKSAEFLFLLLCRAFLSRRIGFENTSARRGDRNSGRSEGEEPSAETDNMQERIKKVRHGIRAKRISGGHTLKKITDGQSDVCRGQWPSDCWSIMRRASMRTSGPSTLYPRVEI